MSSTMRRYGAAWLAVVALGVLVSTASAQFGTPSNSRGGIPQMGSVNPAFNVAPGLQIYSNLFNAAVLGRTVRQFPPWAYGYNPYGSSALNTGGIGGYPLASGYGLGGYPSYGYGGLTAGYPSSSSLLTTGTGAYDSTLTSTGGYPSYGGYGGYPGYGYMDPNYGFLSGTSDVINALGNYYKNVQASRLTQTQADESRIDYRRRLIDEARYERGLLPTSEELRQQDLARNLDWARHQPPIGDIASAQTLNALLGHLTSDPSVGKGPNVPLDDDVLKRINVTTAGNKHASLGLLKVIKDGGKLEWPQPLNAKEFDGPRKELAQHMAAAVEALGESNQPPAGMIADLTGDLQKLRNLVEKSEMPPTDYIAARGYLDQISSAVVALQDPNVVANFNNKFAAKNVAELIDHMKTKGLDFAPAAPGDEGAYRALQQALVAFDYGASGQASTTPPAPPAPPAPMKEP